MAKQDDTVLHDFCEGIGSVVGVIGGGVVGGIGAMAKGLFGDGWEEAGKFFDKSVDTGLEEGGKVGRQYGPGAVVSLLTIVAGGAIGKGMGGGPKRSA